MNLYWFSDEEGGHWNIIAAKDENEAWQLLAACSHSNKPYDPAFGVDRKMDEEEAREFFELNAVTCIDDITTGEVASIFPREVNFTIRETPGGKLSALTNY